MKEFWLQVESTMNGHDPDHFITNLENVSFKDGIIKIVDDEGKTIYMYALKHVKGIKVEIPI